MTHTQQTFSPINGELYVERPYADAVAIQQAINQAQQAQRAWKSVPILERAALCRAATQALLANKAILATELSWQMGRPLRFADKEIDSFAERAWQMIDLAESKLADIHLPAQPGLTRFIRREPLGIVLSIVPWNYPYLTAVNAIIPALMAGNAVILKHSAQTPLCAERLAAAFAAADLPSGLFQYLHLSHTNTLDLIRSGAAQFVAFTGSVQGGQAVEQAASGRFIGLGLELGGKDPAYVRADANLDSTVEQLVDGAFFNSGQGCCAIERIYVHSSLYADFVEQFVELTRRYVLGNPLELTTTLGPMVRQQGVQWVQQQIAAATTAGATACIAPTAFNVAELGPHYLAPQVLTAVTHAMDIMQTESFGPVVGIMEVASDAEAIHWMNDSRYGLTASMWTQDVSTAMQLGEQLQTGTVYLNRCDYLDPGLAWTGIKDSGRGCTLSEVGYELLTRPKSFYLRTLFA